MNRRQKTTHEVSPQRNFEERPLEFGQGFSLIELLVVVGILAVLTALLLANISSGRARARDAVRKSDFDGIKKALQIYYNDYQSYPADAGGQILGCVDGTQTCDWESEFSTASTVYMKRLSVDPINAAPNVYEYAQTNGGEGFLLSTYLENSGDEMDGKSQLRCGVIANLSAKTDDLYVDCER